MNITYKNKIKVNGQMLTPLQTSVEPHVSYKSDHCQWYTLILNDPYAVGGNHIHWTVINIPGSQLEEGQTILPYVGPAPPKNSGVHIYSFLLFPQTGLQKTVELKDRNIPLKKWLKMLGIVSKPIYHSSFQSQFSGGRTRRKKSKKTKKSRKI
jgi:phosphatidylethanolamine-binding protein (PEBP) family uncharacterized protein